MSRILIVDDEPSILNVLSTLLRSQGHDCVPAKGGEPARDLIRAEQFDLMISDIRMAPIDGLELLKMAKSSRPDMAVIMLTGYGSVETAVAAMKEGAFDYVTKPFKVDELLITVQRALQYRAVVAENAQLRAELDSRYRFENIVAESPPMRKICDMIQRVAPTDSTILVLGESGTGKELVAKAIHAYSTRSQERFVPINCAALPEPLLESELFGHVKGAFTGAVSNKDGLFEVADGGTIFLDEIGSMPLSIQAKLLRVLQDRQIRKVGGTDAVTVNVRVVAATNDRLETLIEKGRFREDLYYRLSVIPIEIPPLRERREDIMPLVHHMIRKELGPNRAAPTLDPDVQVAMERYPWPGNVRELENAVRHALTFFAEGKISMEVLPAKITRQASRDTLVELAGEKDPENLKSLKSYVRTREMEYISHVLKQVDDDKEKAAKILKVSLATLYRKIPSA
ncbi:MAG TPA: sigma-54 dependent transcriptional regulator [Kiritimatiellia bacterium]|nr:sigma-54 dependent transcriptional regulator [Kiritimatiellia bacterium]HMO99287.1 sigma-54 dependent transcriptional regulator [Kiritimatiellia bacterium]HMP95619.1 sigma-54 dependent transcriptional regulator [Kiritimatiellia bacterium]